MQRDRVFRQLICDKINLLSLVVQFLLIPRRPSRSFSHSHLMREGGEPPECINQPIKLITIREDRPLQVSSPFHGSLFWSFQTI